MLHMELYQEIEPMMTTSEKGVAKGQRKAAQLLLESKFGPLSEAALARLIAWPVERLDELILAVADAPSIQGLGLETDGRQP